MKNIRKGDEILFAYGDAYWKMFKGRVKMYTGVTVRQPQLPPPPHPLLHQQRGGGVDEERDGWENEYENECDMHESEDDDSGDVRKGRGGEGQASAREEGDDGDVRVREASVGGGGRGRGREGGVQRGIVRIGRRGRTVRERAVASVVEQMRVRVVEVGKRYERGEGGGVT